MDVCVFQRKWAVCLCSRSWIRRGSATRTSSKSSPGWSRDMTTWRRRCRSTRWPPDLRETSSQTHSHTDVYIWRATMNSRSWCSPLVILWFRVLNWEKWKYLFLSFKQKKADISQFFRVCLKQRAGCCSVRCSHLWRSNWSYSVFVSFRKISWDLKASWEHSNNTIMKRKNILLSKSVKLQWEHCKVDPCTDVVDKLIEVSFAVWSYQ